MALDDDSLLASMASLKDDHDLARLHTSHQYSKSHKSSGDEARHGNLNHAIDARTFRNFTILPDTHRERVTSQLVLILRTVTSERFCDSCGHALVCGGAGG